MKFFKKTLLPLLVAFILLLGSSYGCILQGLIGGVPSYSNRKYVAPDEQAIATYIDNTLKLSETPGQETRLVQARSLVLSSFYNVLTSYTVASIEYNKDVTNKTAKERYEYISKYANELQNSVLEMEKKIFSTSYKDYFVSNLGQEYVDGMLEYKVKSEDLLSLESRETELASQYSAVAQNEDAAELASIYAELVKTRNQIAALNVDADGKPYENYMDYAYAEVYGRDYTPDDAESFRESIIAHIKPVMEKIKASSVILKSPKTTVSSLKKYASAVIAETAPSIHSSWQYMMRYGLYDFELSATKANTSYVTEFHQYGDGFMFINPSGAFVSYLDTVLHEFGHYNAIFYEDESKSGSLSSSNYDLLETHSQGFELITLPAVKRIFEKYSLADYYQTYAYNLIYNSVSTLLLQSVIDDFEYAVYSAPSEELTKDFLEKTFADAFKKYFSSEITLNYYKIPHLYQSPAYCISYAVSMTFASEIWISDNNVDVYLNVVSYGANHYLSEVYKPLGLENPLLPETIQTVAKAYDAFADENF